jgi:hypothetical protein
MPKGCQNEDILWFSHEKIRVLLLLFLIFIEELGVKNSIIIEIVNARAG